MEPHPRYPIYIVSKGRWDSRKTAKALDRLGVLYSVVVERGEHDAYASVIDPSRLLILDPAYQRDYDTFDDLGLTKSAGPGPARNFAWDHAISLGASWHWVMDDNITHFARLLQNKRVRVTDGEMFRAMEMFCERHDNVAMAGPCYRGFMPENAPVQPFILNTRIYSCNLIRNDIPFRWRGRYNEDTDLSLRILKAGYATVQFRAFLQDKMQTQQLKGGNTDAFYAQEGTLPKSEMLARMHPDVASVVWKLNRWHHQVDYRPFHRNKLQRPVEFAPFDAWKIDAHKTA